MLGKLCLEGVIIIFFFLFLFLFASPLVEVFFFFSKRVCGECLYEDFHVGL